jgi:hypothetical protein
MVKKEMIKKIKEKKKRNILLTEVKNDEMFRRVKKNIKIASIDYGFQYDIIPKIIDIALIEFIERNKKDIKS